MQLNKITIGRKNIKFSVVYNPDSGDETKSEEEHKVTAYEQPLPDLSQSFGELPKVLCEAMAFSKGYISGMVVDQLAIRRTKNGTRAIQLRGLKSLETIGGEPHKITAPWVKIDKPEDGESGEVQLKSPAIELVEAAITAAEAYAQGQRSQELLNFDEDKAALNAQANENQPELV